MDDWDRDTSRPALAVIYRKADLYNHFGRKIERTRNTLALLEEGREVVCEQLMGLLPEDWMVRHHTDGTVEVIEPVEVT